MPRNCKEFTESTTYKPSGYIKELLQHDKLFSVFKDLQNRVKNGKNFGRKQQNKERLDNFIFF